MTDDIGLPWKIDPKARWQILDRDGRFVCSTLVGTASKAIAINYAGKMVERMNGKDETRVMPDESAIIFQRNGGERRGLSYVEATAWAADKARAEQAEAKLAECEDRLSDAADELAGSTGLTPGDQIKIDSAYKILDTTTKDQPADAGRGGGGE